MASLSRRLFLGRLGATSAATLTASTAIAAAPMPADNAELARIGQEMAAAETRYLRADDAYKAAFAKAEQMMPPPPASIIATGRETRSAHVEPLRLVDDNFPNWREAEVFVVAARRIEEVAEAYDDLPIGDPRRRGGPARRAWKARAEHEVWMAARERVREESGFDAASTEKWRAREAISKLAEAAFEHEAQTPADLLVLARAFNTMALMDQSRNWSTALLGPKLALAAERVLSA
jgi:hypothetical protein